MTIRFDLKRAGLLAGAALLAACGGHGEKEEAVEKPVVSVKTAQATLTTLAPTITAPATVFPREQANLSARITAPIRELRAHKGDSVKAGQVLALLENRDLLAARQEAQGSVENAQASLEKTVSGTLPTDVGRAQGQVDTTQAALTQAQQLYERRQKLFQQGAIPQRDLLQSQTDLATARSNFEVARRALDLLQNQSRASDVKIAQSTLEQARARLNAANANLAYTEIRAPFSGSITDQLQYPGDMAQPGTVTFTIMDLSAVTARAQVPEAQAGRLRQGEACAFSAVDSPDESIAGRITVVSRAVDPQRRTVEVWCEINRPPASLRGGVFGSVSIVTGSGTSAVVVPLPAVQLDEGTRHGSVFVIGQDHAAHKREIDAGETVGGQVAILKGLNAGEQVVVEGAYGLPDGAKVRLPGEKEEEGKKE